FISLSSPTLTSFYRPSHPHPYTFLCALHPIASVIKSTGIFSIPTPATSTMSTDTLSLLSDETWATLPPEPRQCPFDERTTMSRSTSATSPDSDRSSLVDERTPTSWSTLPTCPDSDSSSTTTDFEEGILADVKPPLTLALEEEAEFQITAELAAPKKAYVQIHHPALKKSLRFESLEASSHSWTIKLKLTDPSFWTTCTTCTTSSLSCQVWIGEEDIETVVLVEEAEREPGGSRGEAEDSCCVGRADARSGIILVGLSQ
ncbi:hypothetical protein V8F33_001712, partial [Rhypophila sp. PSN 637]